MRKTPSTPIRVKIPWRTLFYSGIFAIIIGSWVASAYSRSQNSLILGFAVIILGIGLMATGYLISQGRIGNKKTSKFNPTTTFHGLSMQNSYKTV
jgi:predicted membrane channel-forming protein YqfA (hemolysin III family)